MRQNWLLLCVPVAIGLAWYGANPIAVFVAATLALVPLAALTEQATDALGSYMGPTWSGLLNASLGNAPEIIIGFFALRQGLVNVVKSSLVGSIIGSLLFALGVSMFAGGLRNGTQRFNRGVAGMNGALLLLAASGLIIPAVFHYSSAGVGREISLEIAATLFAVYLASLVYTLVTSRPVMSKEAVRAEVEQAPEREGGETGWGRHKALAVLTAVTIGLAVMSEILTDALGPASANLGLTATFSGVFLLAMVGNVAQILNAASFARAGKMDLALGVTVGSSIQVALVVAPVLVFASHALGHGMDLRFTRFEIVAVVVSVILTRHLTLDGRSNWLEGLMLIAVYAMFGFAFFWLPPEVAVHG